MKRYPSKRFSSKAVITFSVVLLFFVSPPTLAFVCNPADYSRASAFTGLDIPAGADIRMLFNNASLLVEMTGGSTDSESFTNQVIITKGQMPDYAAGNSGSSSIKKLNDDDAIQMGAIVTPEPATILILGLGSLVLIRKSRA